MTEIKEGSVKFLVFFWQKLDFFQWFLQIQGDAGDEKENNDEDQQGTSDSENPGNQYLNYYPQDSPLLAEMKWFDKVARVAIVPNEIIKVKNTRWSKNLCVIFSDVFEVREFALGMYTFIPQNTAPNDRYALWNLRKRGYGCGGRRGRKQR